VINDSYNSNPLSLRTALEAIKDHPARARWVVSGDMLELGQYERQGHEMIGLRAAQVADILLTLGTRSHIVAEAARRSGMRKSSVMEFAELEPIVDG
jgi:UDP-N-acetylmuramoyl-tripeptide--D-alanyl-D-alanine ligase